MADDKFNDDEIQDDDREDGREDGQEPEGGAVPNRTGETILDMGGLVKKMIHRAIDAFVTNDVDKAERVWDEDESVDDAYIELCRDVQANIRVDWIHTPGSDLFLVYNTAYHFTGDNDELFDPRATALLRDQVGILKLTYLVLL